MAEKKKRSRDPLGVNAHEERRKKQDPDVSLAYLKEGNATNKKRKDEGNATKKVVELETVAIKKTSVIR